MILQIGYTCFTVSFLLFLCA